MIYLVTYLNDGEGMLLSRRMFATLGALGRAPAAPGNVTAVRALEEAGHVNLDGHDMVVIQDLVGPFGGGDGELFFGMGRTPWEATAGLMKAIQDGCVLMNDDWTPWDWEDVPGPGRTDHLERNGESLSLVKVVAYDLWEALSHLASNDAVQLHRRLWVRDLINDLSGNGNQEE